jgi:hypothetical protein
MIEDLREQLKNARNYVMELGAKYKTIKDEYDQLKAKQNVNTSIPAVSGNTLRTKVVVSQIFREALQLRSSKIIYANVLIDVSQNKYVRLEPV